MCSISCLYLFPSCFTILLSLSVLKYSCHFIHVILWMTFFSFIHLASCFFSCVIPSISDLSFMRDFALKALRMQFILSDKTDSFRVFLITVINEEFLEWNKNFLLSSISASFTYSVPRMANLLYSSMYLQSPTIYRVSVGNGRLFDEAGRVKTIFNTFAHQNSSLKPLYNEHKPILYINFTLKHFQIILCLFFPLNISQFCHFGAKFLFRYA